MPSTDVMIPNAAMALDAPPSSADSAYGLAIDTTTIDGMHAMPGVSKDSLTRTPSKTKTTHKASMDIDSPSNGKCEKTSQTSPVTHGFSIDVTKKTAFTVRDNDYNTTFTGIRQETSTSLFKPTWVNKALNTNTSTQTKPTEAAAESSSLSQHASALDALASLASSAHNRLNQECEHDVHDHLSMPPPPPRRIRRMRSASNPEGMEKWDFYSCAGAGQNRLHFVLPSSILEEELASATDACEAYEKQKNARPVRKIGMTDFSIHSQPEVDFDSVTCHGTSPNSVDSPLVLNQLQQEKENKASASCGKSKNKAGGSRPGTKKTTARKKTSGKKRSNSNAVQNTNAKSDDSSDSSVNNEENEENKEPPEEVNEADLEPEKLLKRARMRLFEDLSTENGMEKGALAFPHSLDKYKELYNKNGRIGIYTPAERAAIIAKFNSKRTRRTWKKKIRYNCRKSLADRRMRVKGRFVKRSVEQNAKDDPVPKTTSNPVTSNADEIPVTSNTVSDSSASSGEESSSRPPSPIPIAAPSGPLASVKEDVDIELDMDVDMPDVNDPDAGFKPTASQPYRRTRRHTIT